LELFKITASGAIARVILTVIAGLTGALRMAAADEIHDHLTIAVNQIPENPIPIGVPNSVAVRYLRGFLGRSLTIYDKSWSVACELCTNLPTLENGQAKIVERADETKGMDITFELDPNLRWGDGVPITSADVVFSVEVAHKLGRGSARLPNVLDAVALDPRHFTLRTSSIGFDYNRFEELVLLPAHLEEATYRAAATPQDYVAHSGYTTDPGRPGLYYGPYRVATYEQERVELIRNEFWSGHPPAFDKITLQIFYGAEAVTNDLLGGKVDMVSGEVGLGVLPSYALQKKDSTAKFDFVFKTNLEYVHIDLNLENKLLSDIRIRRALLLSLDRKILFQVERRDIAASFLPPTSPNYDPTLEQVAYDPVAAGALFDQAGFRLGPDGIRTDAAGHRLSFRLLAAANWGVAGATIDALCEQWRRSGVEVTVDSRMPADVLPHRDFDMAYYSWRNTPEFPLEPVYGGAGIPTAANGYSGFNFPGLNNREMNEASTRLMTEMNPAKRLILWQSAQRIYAEQLPALPLFFSTNVYVLPNWLTGVEPTGHMIPTSYWVEDWRVR
jgi:peptide/nickel transport system substrate-binding protein